MPSKISWTDETWSPVVGCTKCSPGCKNCYAERMAKRLYWMGMEKPSILPEYMAFEEGWKNGHIELCGHRLDVPLHWRKPRRVFVCSMSDLFHPKVPLLFQIKVMDILDKCPQHTFLVLTKRPKKANLFFGGISGAGLSGPPIPNLHLGVSISTQAEADEKIPILLQIPARVRWLSIEPMLGPVELRCIIGDPRRRCIYDCLRGTAATEAGVIEDKVCGSIDWVVVGCESGPGRRPCKLEWVRDIIQQCKAASVAVFVKQLDIDGKVERDMKKFPKDLQIQEYPK